MFVVSDSGQCTTLRNAINVERLSDFLENLNQLRSRDSIAHAQTGQPMNLGKRAQNDNISAIAHVAKRIGWIVQKFKIGFIPNGDDLVRHPGEEIVDLLLPDQ